MNKIFKKLFVCLAGMFILALGIAVSTRTGLGISPLNSLSFVIGELTGIQMGTVTMILYCIYVLIEAVIKGRDFKAFDLIQIPVAVVFGMFVNFTKSHLVFLNPDNYAVKLLLTLFSAFLIALGTTVYVSANFVSQAPEGLVLAISQKYKLEFANVKNGMDITIVLLALAVSLIFAHKVIGIREGTIITALLVGRIIALIKPVRGRISAFVEN